MTDREPQRESARRSVLVVSHYYPPHVGGIEEVARAEAIGLAAHGLLVTVLTSSPGASEGRDPVDTDVRVVRVSALNIFERFGVPFPLFFLPSLILRSWTEVRRADVVHVHDTLYLSSWAVALWCRLLRKPLVVTKHVACVVHPWRAVAVAQSVVHRTVGRFVCRAADVVFYMNTGIRDILVRTGVPLERLAPLPNGVDLAGFAPPASSDERISLRRRLNLPTQRPLVLFVGRLVHKKGYHHLIQAAEQQQSWTVVLVGDGDHVPTTRHVLSCGAQDRDTVRLLYRACDVFALPSRSEGFPLTVQEAMASGMPVVTTDDPGYDMYGLNPSLVSLVAADSPRLSEVITALVDDPEQRGRMARYSRRFAEDNFSWTRHVDALMQTFDRVLAGPDASSAELARP